MVQRPMAYNKNPFNPIKQYLAWLGFRRVVDGDKNYIIVKAQDSQGDELLGAFKAFRCNGVEYQD